jgi:citronellyl-CoA dehydrogenase
MNYTADHLEIMQLTTRFCEHDINPHVAAWEVAGIFPAHDLFKKMGKLGLLGINKPTAYGGLGMDYSYHLAFCEALGASKSGSINLAVGVQTDMATPALARFGSDALREEFLRPTIEGDMVACLGVSEVEAGSDFAGIRTSAVKDGDDYRIAGGKMWITNGTQADWIALLCNTNDGSPHLNKSLICVPLRLPGITVLRPLDKLGMNASDTAQIFFDDVRVPQRYRIGSERRGLLYQVQAFNEERLWVSACGLVAMERAIKDTIAYTRERKAFGRRILDNQVVHYRLAELQTKVELLRSLVYRAVDDYILRSDGATQLISMAKLTAGRLQRELIDGCLQFYGGMGYLAETEISRLYRDGRLTSIGGGADEVMLMMICRTMGILPE